MVQLRLTAALLCLAAASCARAEGGSPIDVAIVDVGVVDVAHGTVAAPRTVLIADDRIVAVEASVDAIPEGAQRIDGRGRFLIPGLVDMHVHLFNNATHRPPNDWTFPLFIANGVTAVREMAAIPDDIARIRRWNATVAARELIAPRVVSIGIPLKGPPEDVARQAELVRRSGADFIKVFSDVTDPAWRAILRAARRNRLAVAGHVPGATSLLASARDGLHSNEHLMEADTACSSIEREVLEARRGLDWERLAAVRTEQAPRILAAFDQGTCDRVARELAALGQVQVPTLILSRAQPDPEFADPASDPRWHLLRTDEQARWRRYLAPGEKDDADLLATQSQVYAAVARTFHRAGVPMLAGTDAPMPHVYPGYSLQDELVTFVDIGMTPAEALRAATLGPAEFLGIAADTGSIATGKRADLVLLDADPLRDIRNARRIDAVLLGGRVLRRTELDAMLDGAAAALERSR
jgi:imidazolonepropionase-like amidohydrolase